YTLVVGGEFFRLTKDQLVSDPGNYFATYFLGDFAEAHNGIGELHISKEPKLFALIQAHLRGYSIFPIPDLIVPSYMTKETMVENLILEAQFYGLGNLETKARDFSQT
ncbi:hypothetical protein CPB86DRAFT_668215, partial [Serendipita vermifera]